MTAPAPTTTCESIRRHFGDPCIKCGTAHDAVKPGECPGRPTPWGDAWQLGRTHAMCGRGCINPEFWKDEMTSRAYVGGYDGIGA